MNREKYINLLYHLQQSVKSSFKEYETHKTPIHHHMYDQYLKQYDQLINEYLKRKWYKKSG